VLATSACVAFVGWPGRGAAQQSDPLAPVSFLAGGKWLGEGRWPDGSPLRVEERYFWGPTKRVLHFETDDLATGQRHLLYEGIILFDAHRGRIVQWNIKPTGELSESEVTHSDSTGWEVKGANTWSVMRYRGANEFRWELRVRQDSTWKPILDATYRRAS
jgi:hypothetical protein